MVELPVIGEVLFASQIGWYAFSSILVLLLVYLMRPKPREQNIPSLMFFLQEKGLSRRTSFFRNFFSSLLFFLQLLALCLLALALTSPFQTITGERAVENSILVVDASASMQAGSRFPDAIAEAGRHLNGKVSIIIAQNVPVLALEDATREEAATFLSALRPKDTGSNIGDAMLLAGDVLKQRSGKVYVFSDFAFTEGPDPIVAKRSLASRGVPAELFRIGGKEENLAIVGMQLGKSRSRAMVRNYGDSEKPVTLVISSGKNAKSMRKQVLPNSVEQFEFDTPQGSSEVYIEGNDALEVDNRAFVSADNIRKIRVLLVTNSERSFLRTALESSRDIELKVAEPPVIHELDYDIVVISGVSTNLVLPDFYREAVRKVRNGTSVIVVAQDGLEGISPEILPVVPGRMLNSSRISTLVVNEFTDGVDFGTAFRLYNVTAVEGSKVIADAGGVPVVVMKGVGAGSIIYYGIFDDFSDFKATVSYPIFWSRLISFLTQTEELGEYNFKTGRIVADSSGKKVYMDKAGFYTVGSRKVSASVLDAEESDTMRDVAGVFEEDRVIQAGKGVEKRDVSLEQYIIIAALVFIVLELLYVKWRGDL